MEEGIFPGYKTIGEPQELEEERRLCYVGITRAKQLLHLTCARQRTIFGSTSCNAVSRFIKEIPASMLDGAEELEDRNMYDNLMVAEDEEDDWGYGSRRSSGSRNSYGSYGYSSGFGENYSTYKDIAASASRGGSGTTYQFRSADSFLNSLNVKKNDSLDLSEYKAGARVFHKKFGEGTINSVETEGEDLKVDISFDKVGHKRLMAKFAGLEIIK